MAGSRRGRGSQSSRIPNEEEEEEEVQEEEEEAQEQGQVPDPEIVHYHNGVPILHPRSLWFNHQTIVRLCTRSTKSKLDGSYTCWSMASASQKEAWFNVFRSLASWTPDLECIVRERYYDTCKRRLKDNMYKLSKKNKESAPEYMKGAVFDGLIKHRSTDEFRAKSKQAKINRRGGVEDGEIEATHFSGSQSFQNRASQISKEKGKMSTAPELFLETHGKMDTDGKRVLLTKKDTARFAAYESMRSESDPEMMSDNEMWLRAVEGYNKGNVFGVGTAHELFYTPPTRTRAPQQARNMSYVPGLASELEQQLMAEREEARKFRESQMQFMQEQARASEERARKEAETNEQMRRMQEEIMRLQTYFPTCPPNYRPPRGPDDPFDGSGASFGFQT